MFLDTTLRRNPGLIHAAQQLHASGAIEPDTYVVDRDAVAGNAAALASVSADNGVTPWFVIKQIGRNPLLTSTIAAHIPAATAIDVREARAALRGTARLGNVGHLVQIPLRALPEILSHEPEVVTVYDRANLRAVAEAAAQAGVVQRVLLRISADAADLYPGQEGGFETDQVMGVLRDAATLTSVKICGVTSFPCALFDPQALVPVLTATFRRVLQAADILRAAGIDPVVNAPSHSSCATIPLLAKAGATHVEPGHALTGTTPHNAADDSLTELPAMVYVSEIAQTEPSPAIFGGGFYARSHATNALIGGPDRAVRGTLLPSPAENIDYYRRLRLSAQAVPLGTTVVMAFRSQIFVTRSHVAVVSGISTGQPHIDGIFDSQGNQIEANHA